MIALDLIDIFVNHLICGSFFAMEDTYHEKPLTSELFLKKRQLAF